MAVSEQLWPEGGGGTLATHLILKLLAESDVDTTVVTGTRNPARTKGVNCIFHPLLGVSDKVRLWISLVQPSSRKWFKSLIKGTDVLYIPRYCYPLIPFAKDLKKKVVVHLHDYQPISYNAAVFHNSQRKGVLGDFGEEALFELAKHASFSRALLGSLLSPLNLLGRMCVAEADEIVCVSKRQAEIIGREAPELAEKIGVIYNPLPKIVTAEKQLGDATMMYLGGEDYLKGFHVFLRAACGLLKQSFDIKFLLTRAFKEKNRLIIEGLNRKSGIAYNLLGYLKYEELLDLHRRSWALLFPSIWEEPLAYAVVESMLAGTVPIASNVGGVFEIVKGTFAERMMFEPGNVDAFVDRIESLTAMSKERVADVGFGLREAVLKRFNSETTKEKLLETLHS